ncbi:DUF3883 domain-containing protein [bacterium]|nr:DUF3883 domain-containing protein [bacterium]
MKNKLCVKSLTASDLTFFKWQFQERNAGNQKSINLNADVFIDALYPDLPALAQEMSGRIPLDLTFYGPGYSPRHNIQRKIRKIGSYKNWRLNGEFVINPVDEPERYNILVPGDFAIMDFVGISYPNAVSVFLISSVSPEDKNIHASLEAWLQKRGMAVVDVPELQQLVLDSRLDIVHPLNGLFSEFDLDLEDAALGSFEGIKRLHRKGGGRSISQEQFKKVRESAESIGRRGEEYLNLYFSWLVAKGELKNYQWTSDINAISPYDFEIENIKDEKILVDAKSTSGDENRTIHVSLAELHKMVESELRYDIYRIFCLSEDSASLKIVTNMKPFAESVLSNLHNLPDGVEIDSVSIDPKSLVIGDEIVLPSIEQLLEDL